ncbi:MAG: NAD(P)/FAD-dependent oxidoreductase [Halioglobus sp.]
MNSALPHTTSYYAASINHAVDYPPLKGEHVADVCVIGAGFTGISTALHLAERGYKVHVLEANRVGWGATGRNGGQIIGGISGEEKMARKLGAEGERRLWDMRWAGHDIIRQRVEKYAIACDLKWGYLDVAIKPRHLRDQEKELAYLQRNNFPFEVRSLSAAETHETIGTHAYIGALLNMGNGHLHPLNLCLGEARAAVAQGAVISEQSQVLRIEDGVKPTVHAELGSVTADAVVLAGNAYHLVDSRLRGHLLPVNSYIAATEPLSDAQVRAINPLDLAVCDPNFILEYFRLSADKRLLFGARLNYSGHDPGRIKTVMRKRIQRVYPQLSEIKLDYAWGGTIGVTVNRVPQLGRLNNNTFYAQGFCGHGVNVTHLAGQIMADAVGGTLERMDVFANIPPVVLPGLRLYSKALVSLGVAYFRLKDRL